MTWHCLVIAEKISPTTWHRLVIAEKISPITSGRVVIAEKISPTTDRRDPLFFAMPFDPNRVFHKIVAQREAVTSLIVELQAANRGFDDVRRKAHAALGFPGPPLPNSEGVL